MMTEQEKREKVIALLERYMATPNLAGVENYGAKIVDMPAPLITDALALLKAQEPKVTCSVCKYSRCLSGEWFCFMIGTSRYGKHVADGDWYCKDAIGR